MRLRIDRAIVVMAVLTLTILAWWHVVHHSGQFMEPDFAGSAVGGTNSWSGLSLAPVVAMWVVMMIAMMLPATLPIVLAFVAINHQIGELPSSLKSSAVLLVAYLFVWTLFSVAAAFGQTVLQSAALLSPQTLAVAPALGGWILVAAGIYQVTPLKLSCLARCKSPHAFLLMEWRNGVAGAFRLGVRHGAYCVVCCWALMALLFVSGVMNLLWCVAIASFVLIERLASGRLVTYISSLVLVGLGVYWIF